MNKALSQDRVIFDNLSGSTTPFLKLLIIVPAYNEEKNIRKTVEDILSFHFQRLAQRMRVGVIVIDDGSSDQTAQIAQYTDAMMISLPFNGSGTSPLTIR